MDARDAVAIGGLIITATKGRNRAGREVALHQSRRRDDGSGKAAESQAARRGLRFPDWLAEPSDLIEWRPHVDHGQKQEPGDETRQALTFIGPLQKRFYAFTALVRHPPQASR